MNKSSYLQTLCVIPGKVDFTDGAGKSRREIRINKEPIAALSKDSFPLRNGREITLVIGGDYYQTNLYRYESHGCIGDSSRKNGIHLRDFLGKYGLGKSRNEEVVLIFIDMYRIIVSKR